jgi:hypothetical protein
MRQAVFDVRQRKITLILLCRRLDSDLLDGAGIPVAKGPSSTRVDEGNNPNRGAARPKGFGKGDRGEPPVKGSAELQFPKAEMRERKRVGHCRAAR